MAATLSRAGLRAMLREVSSAPAAFTKHGGAAAFTKHGGAAASARSGARFCSSSPGAAGLPAPTSCSCREEIQKLRNELSQLRREVSREEFVKLRNELLQLRREVLDENHHLWDRIDDVLKANHGLREKMVLLKAETIANQVETIRTMVGTTYSILGCCGAFMLGCFTAITPLIKGDWQHETLDMWEERLDRREQGSQRPRLPSGMLKPTPCDDEKTVEQTDRESPAGQVAAEPQRKTGSGKSTSSDKAAGHKAASK